MKRALLLLLILLLLVACSDDKSSDEEVTRLSEEVDRLNANLDELSQEVTMLVNTVESYSSQIKTYNIDQDSLSDEVQGMMNFSDITSRVRDVEIDLIWAYLDNAQFGYETISGWIINSDNNKLMVNKIEWVYADNVELIDKLSLNVDFDFPNGFYIYDEKEEYLEIIIDGNTRFYILDDTQIPRITDYDGFVDNIGDLYGGKVCCDVIYNVDKAIIIQQRYLP